MDSGRRLLWPEAILTLLGRRARLVWASDSDPVAKKYVLDKYKKDIWYDMVVDNKEEEVDNLVEDILVVYI